MDLNPAQRGAAWNESLKREQLTQESSIDRWYEIDKKERYKRISDKRKQLVKSLSAAKHAVEDERLVRLECEKERADLTQLLARLEKVEKKASRSER